MWQRLWMKMNLVYHTPPHHAEAAASVACWRSCEKELLPVVFLLALKKLED